MKPSVVLSALLFIICCGCGDDKEKIIETVDEVPEDVFHVDLCQTLNGTVMSMLSESHNNKDKHPQLFSGTPGQIRLTKESDVYVSFVYESASVPSTLGFYVYEGTPPGSKNDIDRKIAFPHVSSSVLTPGDSRRLGRFKAGTTIQFFLVVGGYGNNQVNWSKPTFWTTGSWNDSGMQQHILFRESQCNNVIMAFEDKNVSTGSDNDFNDIVFVISDNNSNQATTAFDLNAVPSM